MRLKYVFNEVLVGLWRNVTMTVAMIITMSVSLTMLGASVLLYLQVDQMKTYYYGEIEVSIFLKNDATPPQTEAIGQAIQNSPLVASKTFESREQAFEKFKVLWRDTPDFVKAITPDSLPASYRVKLKDPEQYKAFAKNVEGLPGIDSVVDQRQLLDKVFKIFNSIQLMSLVVAAYSKRREVAVMKLVGASNWFIQSPFVLEAVVAGVIGAILGFTALFVSKVVLLDGRLQALTNVLTPIPNGNVWLMLPLLALVGAGVSAITAWITLRFYLKV